jgi:hypothetical protein
MVSSPTLFALMFNDNTASESIQLGGSLKVYRRLNGFYWLGFFIMRRSGLWDEFFTSIITSQL